MQFDFFCPLVFFLSFVCLCCFCTTPCAQANKRRAGSQASATGGSGGVSSVVPVRYYDMCSIVEQSPLSAEGLVQLQLAIKKYVLLSCYCCFVTTPQDQPTRLVPLIFFSFYDLILRFNFRCEEFRAARLSSLDRFKVNYYYNITI